MLARYELDSTKDEVVSIEQSVALVSGHPEVSVVIPVKNAVRIIGRVLEAVTAQATPWPYEVIVIDSGSTDGTLQVIRGFESVRLIEIPPAEFGHGRTRNMGVRIAEGRYVALLTHDAIPADESWLVKLVQPLQDDERVAGVFGRHVAHDNASLCTQRDLDLHFAGLREAGELLWMEDEQRYRDDVGYRQLLHFYSDNNSCLRKSVWERLPYPDVDFAEDQLWAKAIIEGGYRKAYAYDAVVKHSHDFQPWETLQRSFDESKAFRNHFGYQLGGRLRDALRNGLAGARSDYRYVRSRPEGSLSQAWVAAGNQLAKHVGHWLGARSARIPNWLQRSISLDMKLKYGPFRLTDSIGRFFGMARERGLRQAISRTVGPAQMPPPQPGMAPLPAPSAQPPPVDVRNDVVGFFRAVLDPRYIEPDRPILRALAEPGDGLDALWFIPDFGAGSGGHLNIFRFMRGLERRGMKLGVVIVGSHGHATHVLAKERIHDYFGAINAEVYFDDDVLPPARRIVATSWITAHVAKHYPLADAARFYFVQDYEPLFYPAGFDAAAAAATYELGFQPICAGSWIAKELQHRHGVKALGHFGFSFDHDTYRAVPKRDEVKRVFFYARPPTARRGFELGLLALDLVGKLRPDVHFIFAGWDMSGYRFDHVHLNAGILPTSALPDLYSQCDVALILSFSNMSLLPYEVMACGCAVVTNDDGCATWGLNQEVASFAQPTPEALAEAIVALLDDPGRRKRMTEQATQFVATTSWEDEISHVHGLLAEGARSGH